MAMCVLNTQARVRRDGLRAEETDHFQLFIVVSGAWAEL